MSKFNDPEMQSTLLDLFVMFGTDAEVARRSDIGRTTIWRMDTISEAGDDLQEVAWNGTVKAWHEHKLDALDMHISDVQQELTISSSRGRTIPMVHSGEYKFEDCEFAMSLTAKEFKEHLEMPEDVRELLGVPRVWEDRKKRVYNPKSGIWERVRATQFIPPTLDAQAKVLSAFAPDVFGDRRKIDLNVTGGLGVSVVGQSRQPPQMVTDLGPSIPALTDQTQDADVIEYNDSEYHPPEAATMSEPFTPDPNSPLTEEQQRILARARSGNGLAADLAAHASQKLAKASAPVAAKPIQPPPPSTYRSDDMDDSVHRVPRGTKIV